MLTELLLTAALSIPFGTAADAWQVLEYSSLPPHEVEFTDQSLTLKVNQSASPIIYPLGKSQDVSTVRVEGWLSATIPINEEQQQGSKAADDFSLRVGLVIEGSKRLNWIQKKLAADWVLQLYALAPDKAGIDHILFLNGVQDASLLGTERVHPASDLIKERFVWRLDRPGPFAFELRLPENLPVLAIWISSDGDDTGAQYQIRFDELLLQ